MIIIIIVPTSAPVTTSAPMTSSAPETVTKPSPVNLLGPDNRECIGSSAIRVFLGRVLGTPEAHRSRFRIGSGRFGSSSNRQDPPSGDCDPDGGRHLSQRCGPFTNDPIGGAVIGLVSSDSDLDTGPWSFPPITLGPYTLRIDGQEQA